MSGWRIVPVEPVAWVIEGTLPGGERLTHYDDSKVGAECGFDDLCMETIGEPVPLYAAAPEPDWEALADAAFDAEAEAFAECVANGTVMQHGQHYARRISILAALKAAFGSKP